MALPTFRNRRIFGLMFDRQNCRTSTVGKDKGFEFYREIFKLDPPYSTGPTTPLWRTGRQKPITFGLEP